MDELKKLGTPGDRGSWQQCECLCGGSFESPPGVEAAREAVRLVSLAHESQFSGLLVLFGAHVLDVHLQKCTRRGGGVFGLQKMPKSEAKQTKTTITDLTGFETQFDLHLARLCADPHVHLEASRQSSAFAHNIIILPIPTYLLAVIEQHDVVVSQVVLAEVGTLL